MRVCSVLRHVERENRDLKLYVAVILLIVKIKLKSWMRLSLLKLLNFFEIVKRGNIMCYLVSKNQWQLCVIFRLFLKSTSVRKWTSLSRSVSHTHFCSGEEDCTDSSSGAYGAEPDLAAVCGGALVSRDSQPHTVWHLRRLPS